MPNAITAPASQLGFAGARPIDRAARLQVGRPCRESHRSPSQAITGAAAALEEPSSPPSLLGDDALLSPPPSSAKARLGRPKETTTRTTSSSRMRMTRGASTELAREAPP